MRKGHAASPHIGSINPKAPSEQTFRPAATRAVGHIPQLPGSGCVGVSVCVCVCVLLANGIFPTTFRVPNGAVTYRWGIFPDSIHSSSSPPAGRRTRSVRLCKHEHINNAWAPGTTDDVPLGTDDRSDTGTGPAIRDGPVQWCFLKHRAEGGGKIARGQD